MRALARFSWRELAHRPLRTALAVAGVAVATAMLVDMLMLGSGIQDSFGRLLASRGYELRISPRGTLPFDTEAGVSGFSGLRDSLERLPEVDGVAPVLATAVELRIAPDGPASRGFALGIDTDEQGILRLRSGTPPGRGEVVLDEETARTLGIEPGDTVGISAGGGLGVASRRRPVRVSGLAEFLYSARGDAPLALPLEDLQWLANRPDRISFAMIRLADGVDPEAARAAVAATERIEVATIAGLVAQAGERLSYFRQLALILGSVSLIVTSLLVGTIMAVSIGDRLGLIAALRAIGLSRASIVGGLTAEALVLCSVAGGLGVGLGALVAGYLEGILSDFPGIPRAVEFFVLEPGRLALAYVLLLAVGGISALVPAWRATTLDISTTLHAEEP